MERADKAGIIAWARTAFGSSALERYRRWVLNAGFQVLSVDRAPESVNSWFELESELPGRPVAFKLPEGAQPQLDDFQLTFGALCAGYQHFTAGRYAEASTAFEPLVAYFLRLGKPTSAGTPEPYWSAVPYLALAMAKSGKADEVAQLVKRLSTENGTAAGRNAKEAGRAVKMPEFDEALVMAISAAWTGSAEEALRW